ncbi:MAG: helix-turn-helix domain-containing protein, partial [Actinomycetota bacterium]|nr:helix-turn-helix domain-containing protein [Actinomycetota bacterium]
MPPRSNPLDPTIPVERFALALRDLHRQAGRPKQHVLATAMHCSHATVSAMLNGRRFPSWDQTAAFVTACGGDRNVWKQRWAQTDREINAEVGTQAHPRPLVGGEFYRTMLSEVNRARHRIMTTYIRHRPPDYFVGFTDEDTARAARAYFDAVVSWSDRPGARSVRRVIATPNAEMRAWAERFERETSSFPRHEIRVVPWPLSADAVNMAIFDDTVVLLAFTAGAAQQLNGFRFDQPDFVRCHIGYFEQLWA